MKKLLLILPLALILCFMVGCQDKEAMAELDAFKAQADIFLFSLSPSLMSPQVDKNAPKVESILETAKLVMKAAKNCFLITLDEAGHPTARIMDPFDPETDMKIWMGTNKNTRKVEQINNDTRATLAYYDAESMGYVTLIGKARLVTDPMLKEK